MLYFEYVVIWVCSRCELSITSCHWGTSFLGALLEGRILPCDQLDKVIVEGDASTSIKDRWATIPIEVSGHNLHTHKDMLKTSPKPLHSQPWQFDVHTWSSVYPRMPFMGPSAAALTTFLISSYLACSQQMRQEKQTGVKLRSVNWNHFYHEGL